MRCLLLLLILIGIGSFAYYQGWLLVRVNYPPQFMSPTSSKPVDVPDRPLDAFAFEKLAEREYIGSPIILERVLEQDDDYTAYLFTYQSDGQKVSGMATLPLPKPKQDKMPVIVMMRGFADQDTYQTGVGTRPAAQVFAKQGFITLAPDFLGYGESDKPEDNIFWERFNRPVQILNLIASLGTLAQIDAERVGLWGHSNGGQVTLSVLEISGNPYPTTLWAPVSKPFPYSALYYTDEFDDQGLRLRYELAELEKLYSVEKYSISEYLDRIIAPIQLHQGMADEEVPTAWSNELVKSLKENQLQVNYFVYPDMDHNMTGAWGTVVQRDMEFFKKNL